MTLVAGAHRHWTLDIDSEALLVYPLSYPILPLSIQFSKVSAAASLLALETVEVRVDRLHLEYKKL